MEKFSIRTGKKEEITKYSKINQINEQMNVFL